MTARPLMGFRNWRLVDEDGQLDAIAIPGFHWNRKGLTIATPYTSWCQRDAAAHTAPGGEGCDECGLHGRYKPPVTFSSYQAGFPVAYGVAAYGGDIEYHERGFRAQQACIVALYDHEPEVPEVNYSNEAARLTAVERRETRQRRLRAAARFYRVPLVPKDGVLAFASEFGDLMEPVVLTPEPGK